MIKVIAKQFDVVTLPESKYKDLIEIDNNIFPFNGYQSTKWTRSAFKYALDNVLTDDFMPCNYLFFFEDGKQIGIIKGNFEGDTAIVELIQANGVGKGYGRKIIEALPSIGINHITGYSTSEALDWWTKMGANFNGRLMFNKYPLFTKIL